MPTAPDLWDWREFPSTLSSLVIFFLFHILGVMWLLALFVWRPSNIHYSATAEPFPRRYQPLRKHNIPDWPAQKRWNLILALFSRDNRRSGRWQADISNTHIHNAKLEKGHIRRWSRFTYVSAEKPWRRWCWGGSSWLESDISSGCYCVCVYLPPPLLSSLPRKGGWKRWGKAADFSSIFYWLVLKKIHRGTYFHKY